MPDRPERNKFIHGEADRFGVVHPMRTAQLRDPGDFTNESDAKAEFERLEALHPGEYVLLKGSPHGDCWLVKRRIDLSVGMVARS
jgi:hypothetical protein